MAEAINSAWGSTGYIADAYFKMYDYGYMIANPKANVFDLSNAKIWATLCGMEYLIEYNYYMKSYFYRSRQLFVSQSELDGYKQAAQLTLSYAQNWVRTLQQINLIATADVHSSDPDGANFNFERLPPPSINLVPKVTQNSKGFVLIANKTSNIKLHSGNKIAIFQNGLWYSNFTHSLCIDDAFGTLYIIIFDPPEQSYIVEFKNKTAISLKNIEISGGIVKILNAVETEGTTLHFDVKNLQVVPNVVAPKFPLIAILLLVMFTTILIATILFKKRGKLKHQLT